MCSIHIHIIYTQKHTQGMISGNKTYFANKMLKTEFVSHTSKLSICINLIKPIMTEGSELWILTKSEVDLCTSDIPRKFLAGL